MLLSKSNTFWLLDIIERELTFCKDSLYIKTSAPLLKQQHACLGFASVPLHSLLAPAKSIEEAASTCATMDVVGNRVTQADEEIEKHEPGSGDMESDPALAHKEECVQPWREQLTVRGMVVALVIGFIYSVIVLKLILSGGVVPTLNVSAALLAFLALRGWTLVLERLGIATRPFTRQENCVVETCAVACYGIAFGGQSSEHFPA